VKIKVDHKWIATEDHTFDAGEHELDDPSDDLLRAVAIGESVGVVHVLEGDVPEGHVESDEESLKALDKAVEDGSWQVGNMQAFIGDHEYHAQNEDLPDHVRESHAAQAEVVRQVLKRVEDGEDYEDAKEAVLNAPPASEEDDDVDSEQ